MISKYLSGPFPVLDLGDIVLRELTDADADAYFEYMSKQEMAAFLTEHNMPTTKAQALQELRYWANLYKSRWSFYWGIALKENNRLIGTAGFNTITKEHYRAELSYDLDHAFWGNGLMLKSIKNILKFGDYIGLIRVQATVITDNQRSINLLERCGFNQEGVLRKYEVVQEKHRDYYMYARVI